MRTAVAMEGVSVVALPGDVALRTATDGPSGLHLPTERSRPSPSAGELDRIAELLSGADRVTILAGAGCAGAHDSLVALAELLKAPVVHTLRGKQFVEHSNPCDVGMTGLLGFSSGYHALMAADLVLLLGTDFPYRQFYPPKATLVQVDIRGEQIGRRASVALGVVGDVGATLDALLPRLPPREDDRHLKAAKEDYTKARSGLDALATAGPPGSKVHPQFVARTLDELATPDAIFACDVGTPTAWAARYLTMNGRRRLVGSFTHASMANALPQAIGAQSAFPGRQVISMSGDGGLAMLLGELLTLRQLDLPVKVIVFKNDSLAFVNLEMEAAGLVPFATDLVNPQFAAMATGAGILGISVTSSEEVRPRFDPGPPTPRTRSRRGGGRSPGDRPPTQYRPRAGPEVRPVRGQGRAERAGGRGHRPREDQLVAVSAGPMGDRTPVRPNDGEELEVLPAGIPPAGGPPPALNPRQGLERPLSLTTRLRERPSAVSGSAL